MKDDLDGEIIQRYKDGYFGKNNFLNRGRIAAILVNAKNSIERNYYEREGSK